MIPFYPPIYAGFMYLYLMKQEGAQAFVSTDLPEDLPNKDSFRQLLNTIRGSSLFQEWQWAAMGSIFSCPKNPGRTLNRPRPLLR